MRDIISIINYLIYATIIISFGFLINNINSNTDVPGMYIWIFIGLLILYGVTWFVKDEVVEFLILLIITIFYTYFYIDFYIHYISYNDIMNEIYEQVNKWLNFTTEDIE